MPDLLRDATRLHEILDAMQGKTVAMLGDVIADEYILGQSSRISREAPILVLEHRETRITPGGGGNVLMNIAALGGIPRALACVGNDEAGRSLRSIFEAAAVDCSALVDAENDTVTKTRILAGGSHTTKQQVIRIDKTKPYRIIEAKRQQIADAFQRAKEAGESVIVSDYGVGVVDDALLATINEASAEGAEILVDSRYRAKEFLDAAAYTPNEEELGWLTSRNVESDTDAASNGQSLLASLRGRLLLLTRGRAGMAILRPDAEAVFLPIYGDDEVADVTGAGDTVIAAFALARAAAASPFEAASIATYAASIVVHKRGTASASQAELRAIFDQLAKDAS